jgi:hypothetical protein
VKRKEVVKLKIKYYLLRVYKENYEYIKYITKFKNRTLGNLCRKVLMEYTSKKTNGI